MPRPIEVFYNDLPDSGQREEMPTGSVRDTRVGKGRFDLLPPHALKRLAQHFENGAMKYGDNNWLKGQKTSRYYDSAMRHLFAYMEGSREEDHMAAVAWNAMAIIQTQYLISIGKLSKELDDLNEEVK